MLGAFITSRFQLHVAPSRLLKQVARWMLFDFVTRYDINGVDMAAQYGVLWTLRDEVIFYAMLPVIAFAQRRLSFRLLPVPVLFALGYFMWPFLFFEAGTLAVVVTGKLSDHCYRTWWQVAAGIGLAVIVISAGYGVVNHLIQALCLVPTFVCLAVSAPLVKPLAWRPLRLVGEISYSNYVFHGAVLYIMGSTLSDFGSILRLPLMLRVGALTVVGSIALGCALICFVLVEQRFIRIGARFASRAARTR